MKNKKSWIYIGVFAIISLYVVTCTRSEYKEHRAKELAQTAKEKMDRKDYDGALEDLYFIQKNYIDNPELRIFIEEVKNLKDLDR